MIESLYLYLGMGRAQLRCRKFFGAPGGIEPLGEFRWDMADPDSLCFDDMPLPKFRYRFLHVVIGSALSRFLVLNLPDALVGRQERSLAAAGQMQHRLGLATDDWDVCVDTRPSTAAEVAWAVHRSVILRLHALARERGMALRSIKPYVSGVWDALLSDPAHAGASSTVLLLLEEDAATTLVTKAGVLQSLSCMPWHGDAQALVMERRRVLAAADPESAPLLVVATAGDDLAFQLGGKRLCTRRGGAAPRREDYRDLVIGVHEGADS